MTISNTERSSEIQRSRVLADLLELYGAVKDDDVVKKPDIEKQILDIIVDNYLYEPLGVYLKVGFNTERLGSNDKQENQMLSYTHLELVRRKVKGIATLHKVSEFYGITLLTLLGNKENSSSQIFAIYNEHFAVFDVKIIAIEEGNFPKIGTEFVLEWISLHQEELLRSLDTGEIPNIPALD